LPIQMKIKKLLLALFFAGLLPVRSQSFLEFQGYIQNYPIVQFVPEEFSKIFNVPQTLLMNYTRLRIKPAFTLGSKTYLKIEAESDLLIYKKLTNFFSVNAKKTNRQIINLKWLIKDDKNFALLNFIDRFYLRTNFSWGRITVGRQRISWGVGRIWNPTDLFNPINPTSFFKEEKDGADAISARVYLGNFSDLNLVFNSPGNSLKNNFGFRFRTNLNGYDFSLISGRFDNHYIIGGDFAGNLKDAGIRGEGIYVINNQRSSFFKYILGIDYQFNSKLYGLLEYHFNGEGEKETSRYNFSRLINGEIINMGRIYLAASISYEVTPLLTFTFLNINNLEDSSGFIYLSGNYSLTENNYLNAGVQLFYGKIFSEYWYYPNSLFLQWEYYF